MPTVVVSARDELEHIVGASNAGAAAYIPKMSPPRLMVAVLPVVMAGGTYFPQQVRAHLDAQSSERQAEHDSLLVKLTSRQREVLRLLLDGRSNAQIANALNISEGTVKQHAYAIYETLGVSSRVQLLAVAYRGGVREDGSPITKGI